MITCGIDAGFEYTKAVILKDREIIGKAFGKTGGTKRNENIKQVYETAISNAGIQPDAIESICVTGKGKYNTELEGKRITEIAALETATRFLCSEATETVSLGADETLVVVLGEKGISEYTINQKCLAGYGIFLENLLDEFGIQTCDLFDPTDKNITINDTCVPFMRMEVLELLNRDVPVKDIVYAVIEAAVSKTSAVINDITVPDERKIALAGGLAENRAFTDVLMKVTGKNFEIIDEAKFVGAIGAALVADE